MVGLADCLAGRTLNTARPIICHGSAPPLGLQRDSQKVLPQLLGRSGMLGQFAARIAELFPPLLLVACSTVHHLQEGGTLSYNSITRSAEGFE